MSSDEEKIKKCFTDVNTPEKFRNVWINDSLQVCLNFANTYFFKNPLRTRTLFENMFNKVMPSTFSQSGQETAPESYIKTRICLPSPGICEQALTNACAPVTRSEAEGNGNIRDYCGCHLQPNAYSKYTDTYRSSQYCDPLCANSFTIQATDFAGTPISCNQSFCIIDDVTVDVVRSQLGDITFDQICGGCSGNCVCSINNTTISIFDSQVGDINFSQECGGGLSCFEETENGTVISSGCVGSLANEDSRKSDTEITEQTITRMSLITIIFFCLMLLFVGASKKTKSDRIKAENTTIIE